MAKYLVFLVLGLLIVITGCAQKLEVMDLKGYQDFISKQNDTLYVVNFWATWCGPCVKEIPGFLELKKELTQDKIRFVFISLNSLKELSLTEQFVQKNQLPFPTYLLHAGNPNVWIDSIEKNWSGSIPVTLFYKNGEKIFFKEGELEKSELSAELKKYINN